MQELGKLLISTAHSVKYRIINISEYHSRIIIGVPGLSRVAYKTWKVHVPESQRQQVGLHLKRRFLSIRQNGAVSDWYHYVGYTGMITHISDRI
jgi:hypothetical protein